tara:strand:- start:263 stop:1141 length:879 start_codon:yes stop_codon:yes gene_type:complete
MDFFFKRSTDLNRNSLCQGDILDKTDDLKSAIREAHPYYADKFDYTHFMVLTQSCDLVRRPKNCNARYITICAIRPLSTFAAQQLDPLCFESFDFAPEVKLVKKDTKRSIEQKLERLLNNTEPGFFFIKDGSHPRLSGDIVAYLRLSIALNIRHYDVCIAAKIAELEESFQAKVGWLVGNEYSRVGTKDIGDTGLNPEKIRADFVNSVLGKSAKFLSKTEFGRLKRSVSAIGNDDDKDIYRLIDTLEKDDKYTAANIAEEISKVLKFDDETKKKIRNIILSNTEFKRISKDR